MIFAKTKEVGLGFRGSSSQPHPPVVWSWLSFLTRGGTGRKRRRNDFMNIPDELKSEEDSTKFGKPKPVMAIVPVMFGQNLSRKVSLLGSVVLFLSLSSSFPVRRVIAFKTADLIAQTAQPKAHAVNLGISAGFAWASSGKKGVFEFIIFTPFLTDRVWKCRSGAQLRDLWAQKKEKEEEKTGASSCSRTTWLIISLGFSFSRIAATAEEIITFLYSFFKMWEMQGRQRRVCLKKSWNRTEKEERMSSSGSVCPKPTSSNPLLLPPFSLCLE